MGFEDIEPELQDTVNKLSLVAAVIVLSTWSLIGILRSNLVNRVTLGFQILIAFFDILRHLSKYFLKVENETICEIVGALINSSDHLYIAFNTLLAINAHLIFISRQRPKMSFYPLYTYAAVMYIGIINFSYYSNGYYGRNEDELCFYKDSDKIVLPIIKFYIVYIMEAPGVLYCGYVTFLVMFKYKERMSKLRIIRNEEYRNLEDESYKPVDHIGKLYWRVSMYPISCFLTMLPHLIGLLIYDISGKPPLWYYFFYRLFSRLPGTTNFLFMLYDPNFHHAIRELSCYIRYKFTKKLKDDKTYELEEHIESNKKEARTSQDRVGRDEDWNIEFNDGYRMTVQNHIKYL